MTLRLKLHKSPIQELMPVQTVSFHQRMDPSLDNVCSAECQLMELSDVLVLGLNDKL